MSQIGPTVNTIECNPSSHEATLEKVSGKPLQFYRNFAAQIRGALFTGIPSEATFVTDTSNISSIVIYGHDGDAMGSFIFSHDVNFANTTYAAWVAGTGQHFTASITANDTAVTVPSDGTYPFFFVVRVITTDAISYMAAFGYGEIVEVGIPAVSPTVLPPEYAIVMDAQNRVATTPLNFINSTVLTNMLVGPIHLADNQASVDKIYYSTDASKLVYKDSSGTVHNLY